MPSPFPGVNPYLEQPALWPDFHSGMLNAIKERLVPLIRPRYYALLERHVYIEEPLGEPTGRRRRGDLLVAASRPTDRGGGVAVLETEVEAPAIVDHLAMETERVAYLEIRERQGGALVTVVELLSPTNKRDDRSEYLAKREKVLGSSTHLVEIDLLRGGRPMPEINRPPSDYSVLVSWSNKRPRAGFWPIGLRDPLPVIPIPLLAPDPSPRIDLQEALNHVYDASGYEDFIYQGDPDPPVSPENTEWAKRLAPPRP